MGAAGLLASGLLVWVGMSVPFWIEAARVGATFDDPGGTSLPATALNAFVGLLPGAIALAGLVRARAWGPSAAVANGLLVLLPALLLATWVDGPQDGYFVGMVVSHVLLLAAAGVAATLLPWSMTAPTPARALLWLGAAAVIAGQFLPVSAEGRGVESWGASVMRFGGTPTQFASVSVGLAALVAIAVVADRLPPRLGAGAAAVMAAGGLAPLSPTLMTWLSSQPISPLAALGPVGSVALAMYLAEIRKGPSAGTPLDSAATVGQAG